MSVINMIYKGELDPRTAFGPPKRDGMWPLDWYGTPVRVRRGKAIFRISAYVESLNHDFGYYNLICETKVKDMSVSVTGRNMHPHWDGYLCWGAMGSARDYAKDRGDVETIGGLVETILNSYNPRGPFGGWWNDPDSYDRPQGDPIVCVSCGDRIRQDGTSCASCDSDICAICNMYCTRDLLYYCKSCYMDVLRVTACASCRRFGCTHRSGKDEQETEGFSVTLAQAQEEETQEETDGSDSGDSSPWNRSEFRRATDAFREFAAATDRAGVEVSSGSGPAQDNEIPF